jgi:CRISPR-associated Csx2 family protein
MSRRVLITFLGTGDYVGCHYMTGYSGTSFQSGLSRYIQLATVEYWLSQTESVRFDKIMVIMTTRSQAEHWLTFKAKSDDVPAGIRKDDELPGLLPELKELITRLGMEEDVIQPCLINYDNPYLLFSELGERIQPYDRIYLDITHGFRTTPLVATIMLNYWKALKQVELHGLTYGNLEHLGYAALIRQMPTAERLAKIEDYSDLLTLFEWTNASRQFIDTGNPQRLMKLANDVSSLGKSKDYSLLRDIVKNVNNIYASLQLVRNDREDTANSVSSECESLQTLVEKKRLHEEQNVPLSHNRIDFALRAVLDKVTDKVAVLHKDENGRHWRLLNYGKWCKEHQMYTQALAYMREGTLTFFASLIFPSSLWIEYEIREHILKEFLMVISGQKGGVGSSESVKYNLLMKIALNLQKLKDEKSNHPEVASLNRWQVMQQLGLLYDLLVSYLEEPVVPGESQKKHIDTIHHVFNTRNDVMHAGQKPKDGVSPVVAIVKLVEKIEEYMLFLQRVEEEYSTGN